MLGASVPLTVSTGPLLAPVAVRRLGKLLPSCPVAPLSIVRLPRKFAYVSKVVVEPDSIVTAPSHSPLPAIACAVPLKFVWATLTVPLLVKVVPVTLSIPVPLMIPALPTVASPLTVRVLPASISRALFVSTVNVPATPSWLSARRSVPS